MQLVLSKKFMVGNIQGYYTRPFVWSVGWGVDNMMSPGPATGSGATLSGILQQGYQKIDSPNQVRYPVKHDLT